MTRPSIEEVARGLTQQERDIARALCGNAWEGRGQLSPGIAIMNGMGLMHVDALKDSAGRISHYRAKPTELGLAVRTYLERNP